MPRFTVPRGIAPPGASLQCLFGSWQLGCTHRGAAGRPCSPRSVLGPPPRSSCVRFSGAPRLARLQRLQLRQLR
eukprot:5928486-Alexandrium_andersonii.AAC.1